MEILNFLENFEKFEYYHKRRVYMEAPRLQKQNGQYPRRVKKQDGDGLRRLAHIITSLKFGSRIIYCLNLKNC